MAAMIEINPLSGEDYVSSLFRFLVIAALLPAIAAGQADAEAEPPVVSIFVVEPAISNHAIQAHKELPGATCRPGTKLLFMRTIPR